MKKYPRVQDIYQIDEDIVRTIRRLIEDKIKSLSITLSLGTFDVSLVTVDDGIFEVKAVGGDGHLG